MLRAALPGSLLRRLHPASANAAVARMIPCCESARRSTTNDFTSNNSGTTRVNGSPTVKSEAAMAAMLDSAVASIDEPVTTVATTAAAAKQTAVQRHTRSAAFDEKQEVLTTNANHVIIADPAAVADPVVEKPSRKKTTNLRNAAAQGTARQELAATSAETTTTTKKPKKNSAGDAIPLESSVVVKAMRDAANIVVPTSAADDTRMTVAWLVNDIAGGASCEERRRELAKRHTKTRIAKMVSENPDAMALSSALDRPKVKKALDSLAHEANARWAVRTAAGSDVLFVHIDADMFMCAVEVQRNPGLGGGPFVIATTASDSTPQSVVLAADYKARMYGIARGTPLAVAQCACPMLTVCQPDPKAYEAANDALLLAARKFDPNATSPAEGHVLVDAKSVAGSMTAAQLRAGKRTAADNVCRKVWMDVMTATQLPCSAGAAPTPVLAAVAAALHKPHGATSLPHERDLLCAKLGPLDVSRLRWLSPEALGALDAFGVSTLADVSEKLPVLLRHQGGLIPAELVNMLGLAVFGVIENGPVVRAVVKKRRRPLAKKAAPMAKAAQSAVATSVRQGLRSSRKTVALAAKVATSKTSHKHRVAPATPGRRHGRETSAVLTERILRRIFADAAAAGNVVTRAGAKSMKKTTPKKIASSSSSSSSGRSAKARKATPKTKRGGKRQGHSLRPAKAKAPSSSTSKAVAVHRAAAKTIVASSSSAGVDVSIVPEPVIPEVIVRHELGSLAPATVNARRRLTGDMDAAARGACLKRALDNAVQELTNSPFATGAVTVDIKALLPDGAGAIHHSATVDLSTATRDAVAIGQALQAAAMRLPELGGGGDDQKAATAVEVSVNLSGLTRV